NARTNVDHRAPFREAGAALVIFLQAFGELVEPDGDQFPRTLRQRLRALVDLDAGDRARLLDQLDQRRSVLRVLPDGFVVKNDTRDVVAHRLRGAEQHLAIAAAVLLVDSTLMASKRFLIVPEDSSAARMPLPGDTMARATLLRSARLMTTFSGDMPLQTKIGGSRANA